MRNLSLTGLTFLHIEFYSYLSDQTGNPELAISDYSNEALFNLFYQATVSDFCSIKCD